MAIRSGSGGLKYPLPIDPSAQQSIAAASSGGSAAASAYGANRSFAANKMRVQADLANSAAERNYRAMAQMEGQRFDAEQAYYDRENRKGAQLEAQRFDAERQEAQFGQQTQLQQSGQQFNREMQWQDQYFQAERDRQGYARDDQARQQQIADQAAQTEAEIQAGTKVLTPQAQQQMDTLDADRAKWATDQTMSPTQRAEAEQQYQDRKRRIMGTAVQAGPDATQRANQQQTFFDPQTGRYEKEMGPGRVPGTVGQNGQFQPTVDNSGQQQDQQKQVEDLYKDAQSIAAETDAEGAPRYSSFDDALAEARKRRASAGLPVPGQQQPGGQPVPAPGQPEPPPPPAPGQQPPVPAQAPGQVPLPTGHPNAQPPQPPGQLISPPVQGMGDSAKSRSGSDIPGAGGITPDAFKQQWGSLAPGSVMYGPDGKLYTKK